MTSKAGFTPGPWTAHPQGGRAFYIHAPHMLAPRIATVAYSDGAHSYHEANARLIAAAPTQDAALNYVADMTYCGADAEWHFKPGYDPQIVLDAIKLARGEQS